jgi:hypothetical protein
LKAQCLALYKKAAESRSEDLTQLSVMFTNQVQQSEKLQPGQHNPLAAHYLARAHEVDTARDAHQNVDNLEAWYAEDRASFEAGDADANGTMDKTEFRAVAKDTLGMDDHKADKLLEKWDVDKSDTIGPVEWCTMSSVLRAEKVYKEQKFLCTATEKSCETILPGGKCCAAICVYWGLGCSLCTLCTSFCCTICWASKAAERMTDGSWEAEHRATMDQAKIDSLVDAKKSASQKLLNGPKSDTLIKMCKSAQSTRTTLLAAPGQNENQM